MRSPVIDASGVISSRHGSTSWTVVLMTSASPEASVLQSSASKAASLPNSKPSSMPAMIETRVGTSP